MKEIIKKFNLKLENGVYNSDQSVILTNEDLFEGGIPIKFGKVKGDFSVKDCTELQSLINSPTEVTGNFDCSDCTSLSHFWFISTKIGGSIDCSGCYNVTTLNSLPQVIEGDLNCSNTQIADFEPITEVKGNLNCSHCKQLRSLKTLPKIGGKLDCSKCSFKITISKWFRKS